LVCGCWEATEEIWNALHKDSIAPQQLDISISPRARKTEGQIVAQRELVMAVENALNARRAAHHSKPFKRQI